MAKETLKQQAYHIIKDKIISCEYLPNTLLNEEKLQTSKRIRDYQETIRLYMRLMTCKDMVSLTEVARQYSEESSGYVIQSWMRSRNTLEFLR